MALGTTPLAALMERYDKGVRGMARDGEMLTGEVTALRRGARPSREQLKKIAKVFGMSEADLAIVLLTGETREAAHGADDDAIR